MISARSPFSMKKPPSEYTPYRPRGIRGKLCPEKPKVAASTEEVIPRLIAHSMGVPLGTSPVQPPA